MEEFNNSSPRAKSNELVCLLTAKRLFLYVFRVVDANNLFKMLINITCFTLVCMQIYKNKRIV